MVFHHQSQVAALGIDSDYIGTHLAAAGLVLIGLAGRGFAGLVVAMRCRVAIGFVVSVVADNRPVVSHPAAGYH